MLFDAYPVHRFTHQNGQIFEHYVSLEAGTLKITLGPPSAPLMKGLEHLPWQSWPDNYTSEYNAEMQTTLAQLYASLNQGLILIFDYGFSQAEYYHPERCEGT